MRDQFSQNILYLYLETGRMIIGAKKLALGVMTKMMEFIYNMFKAVTEVLLTHTHIHSKSRISGGLDKISLNVCFCIEGIQYKQLSNYQNQADVSFTEDVHSGEDGSGFWDRFP